MSKSQTTAKRPAYRDRMGRIITDPETIEGRWVMDKLWRLTRKLDGADVPVGDLAQATGKSAAEVVSIINRFDVWLWGLVEKDGPVETWKAFVDGE